MKPAILASMDIRRYVRLLLEEEFHSLPILSYQELSRDVSTQPLGRLGLPKI